MFNLVDMFGSFESGENTDGLKYIVLTDGDNNAVSPDDLSYEELSSILEYLYATGEIGAGDTCVFTADGNIPNVDPADFKDVLFDFAESRKPDVLEENLLKTLELLKEAVLYVCDGRDEKLTHNFMSRMDTLCNNIRDVYYAGREIAGCR